mmetsp:Transcript_34116/g.101374  ORF Transcript_34116/g.101374 Transcript_34116/m.101374 type:complete len:222 (+) Transcript_34116:390-1055(+)
MSRAATCSESCSFSPATAALAASSVAPKSASASCCSCAPSSSASGAGAWATGSERAAARAAGAEGSQSASVSDGSSMSGTPGSCSSSSCSSMSFCSPVWRSTSLAIMYMPPVSSTLRASYLKRASSSISPWSLMSGGGARLFDAFLRRLSTSTPRTAASTIRAASWAASCASGAAIPGSMRRARIGTFWESTIRWSAKGRFCTTPYSMPSSALTEFLPPSC